MKKLIIVLVVVACLVGLGFLAMYLWGPQIKDALNKGKVAIQEGIEETKNAINADKGNIRVFEYFEYNDKEGYYLKETKGTIVRDVAVGSKYIYEAKTYDHYTVKEVKDGVIEKVEKNKKYEISVYYNLDTYTITFSGSEVPEAEKTKTFKYGYVLKQKDYPHIVKEGYEFDIPGDAVTKDDTIEIKWKEIERTITLVLADGCSISDSSWEKQEGSNSYTKKVKYSATEVLPTPTSSIYTFKCYVNSTNAEVSSLNHLDKDITLTAQFTETTYTISFICEDGKAYPQIIAAKDAKISAPYIQPENQVAGYGLNWYTDNGYTNLYDFHYMPASDMTLYGKWEEDTGVSFLAGLPVTIDCYEDLVAVYDYVYFSYSTTPIEKEVTYVSFEALGGELQKIVNNGDSQYHGNGKILSNMSETDGVVSISLKMEKDAREYEGTKSVAANDYQVYGAALYEPITPTRSASFNDFYIEKLTNHFTVETTNQLLFVAEHGYKPICKTGSKAEAAYDKCKQILRNIITDDMTNFEKADAIFNYLVLNIQYDHNVLDITEGKDDIWPQYDSYFMEGVLNNKKSVCDGIAKTFSMLCNMEGIPCVEVTGNAHAWCKVKINNIWYVVDATHGNTQLPGSGSDPNRSIMNHGEFLISDAEKAAKGYPTKDFSNIKCNSNFNYFDYKTYTTSSGTINLVVSTPEQFKTLVKYAETIHPNLNGYSLEFYYNTSTSFKPNFENVIFNEGYAYSSVPFGANSIGKVIFTK